MNEHESFESELRSVKPARPPAIFLARLKAAKPAEPAMAGTARARRRADVSASPVAAPGLEVWRWMLRWAVAAAACVALVAVVWRVSRPSPPDSAGPSQTAAAGAQLKADDVEIGRELVVSFDAVARLPSGEPVRFHCQEWLDQVTWRDNVRGLTVERRTPRIEVVPVRFETY